MCHWSLNHNKSFFDPHSLWSFSSGISHPHRWHSYVSKYSTSVIYFNSNCFNLTCAFPFVFCFICLLGQDQNIDFKPFSEFLSFCSLTFFFSFIFFTVQLFNCVSLRVWCLACQTTRRKLYHEERVLPEGQTGVDVERVASLGWLQNGDRSWRLRRGCLRHWQTACLHMTADVYKQACIINIKDLINTRICEGNVYKHLCTLHNDTPVHLWV